MASASENDVFIAVMGATGSGKTSLIQRLTGSANVEAGHGLSSDTNAISQHSVNLEGVNYILIDTPGYDDSHMGNEKVTKLIFEWLAASYNAATKLNGVLFLHPIDHPRMTGSHFENLRMFRDLVGPDAIMNVSLVTTMWDKVSLETAEQREQELLTNPEFWAKMVEKGSRVKRSSLEMTDINIIHDLAGNTKVALQAQDEMVNQGKTIEQTTAGGQVFVEEQQRNLDAEVAKQQQSHEEALARQKQEQEQQLELQRQQAEEAARQQEEERKRAEEEVERQRQQVEEERQRQEREIQERENELARQQAELEAESSDEEEFEVEYYGSEELSPSPSPCPVHDYVLEPPPIPEPYYVVEVPYDDGPPPDMCDRVIGKVQRAMDRMGI